MSIVVETLEKLQQDRKQLSYQPVIKPVEPAEFMAKTGAKPGFRRYALLIATAFVSLSALTAAAYWLLDQSQAQTPVVQGVAEVHASPIEDQQDSSEPSLLIAQAPDPSPAAISQEKNLTVTKQAPVETITPAANTVSIKPSDWLERGYEYFRGNNLNKALEQWQGGFSQLDKDTLLLSVLISHGEKSAVSMLRKLRQNKLDAFIVPAALKNNKAYYTLVLPSTLSMDETMELIKGKTGISSFKIRQSKFQPRIDALRTLATTSTAKSDKNQVKLAERATPAAIKEPPMPQKSVTEQQEIVAAEQLVLAGRYAEATEQLKQYAQTSHHWQTYFWLGSAQLGLGQYDLAEKYLQQAKGMNNQIPQIWIQLAVAAQEQGNHRRALDYLQSARSLAPNAPEIMFNIGFSSDALGDRNGAVLAYREFLDLSGGDSRYLQLRQSVLDRLKDLGASNKRNF